MPGKIEIIVRRYNDENSKKYKEEKIFEKTAHYPKSIDVVGLDPTEQAEIIKDIQDHFLIEQLASFENQDCCPLCGKKIRKFGKISSNFHAIHSDHRILIQRYICDDCGWVSKATLNSIFGTSVHPSLHKIEAELGANFSYKKGEGVLDLISSQERKINNHQRLKRFTNELGEIISELNYQAPQQGSLQMAEELLVHVDGGHIPTKEKGKRSIEVLAGTIYKPENLVKRDKNHNVIINKSCMVSCKEDRLKTAKKYIINTAIKQGISKETKVTAFADGAKNCWSIINSLKPYCKKLDAILDWFHIGKKFKNVTQSLSDDYAERIDHIKWCVWHNKPQEALKRLHEIYRELTTDDKREKINGLIIYLKRNVEHLVNYEKRHNKELPITSNVAESLVENLINDRHKKDKKMQWTREGAHNVLQIRAAMIGEEWNYIWPIALNKALELRLGK
jgi:hypothetical protein